MVVFGDPILKGVVWVQGGIRGDLITHNSSRISKEGQRGRGRGGGRGERVRKRGGARERGKGKERWG